MKFDAKEVIDLFPKIKLGDKKAKLMIMGDDLIQISPSGKIERIIDANIIECRKGKKVWVELEVVKVKLIDKGVENGN